MAEPMRVVLGISGASGAALGLAVARQLDSIGAEIDLVVSRAARRTLTEEIGPDALARLEARAANVHNISNVGARIASGSFAAQGMIVAPCSMRSLAAIAHGLDDNLLIRAASVQLKERRPLVLLAREAPLTLAHLRNMMAVTEMGAIVAPPVPAFYLRPNSLDDVIAQIAARAVDLLRITPPRATAWAENSREQIQPCRVQDEQRFPGEATSSGIVPDPQQVRGATQPAQAPEGQMCRTGTSTLTPGQSSSDHHSRIARGEAE